MPVAGSIVHTDGRVVGKHEGFHKFTIGQHRGLGNLTTKDKLYVINGSWMNRHDFTKGDYRRPGEFSFERADNSDVDPKEISEHLNRWIDGSGVRVINQVDNPAGGDKIQRAIDYQTERTAGSLTYVVQPGAPAKKVLVTIDVREHRR